MRVGRVAPSIKQKRDAVLRVVNRLFKWVPIKKFILEDVQIDIRSLTEEKKLYRWHYQKSNRLDENLRIATLLRDGFQCKQCGASECRLEVHHITPRRYKGADTISNLITLCSTCHSALGNNEMKHADRFYSMIDGKNIGFDYAQHVMQGKNYLRTKLSELGSFALTTGGETANRRINFGVEKSHANDALVIAGLTNNRTAI